MDNVIIAKAAVIERCLKRIHEEYTGDLDELKTNFTKQDSIILNLERLVQACIDAGMHIIKVKAFGHVQHYRDVFDVLEKENMLPAPLADQLKKMVGFRNIAIHEYQALDMRIVQSIIEDHLKEIQQFKTIILNA